MILITYTKFHGNPLKSVEACVFSNFLTKTDLPTADSNISFSNFTNGGCIEKKYFLGENKRNFLLFSKIALIEMGENYVPEALSDEAELLN